MQVVEQGLFLLTVICSLISLLSSCFLLLTCAITGLWKKTSMRLVMYLCLSNIIVGLDLVMPSYRYSFMCAFQSHLLNFGIMTQLIFAALMMHYTYLKVVQETPLSRILEVRYLGIAIVPALIDSIPPFFPQSVQDNCWSSMHSPLQEVVSSFGFLIPYSAGFVFCFGVIGAIILHLKLFPKGFYTEEFKDKVKKTKQIGRFVALVYGVYFIVAVYAAVLILPREAGSFDFIAMFCHASIGTLTTVLFLNTEKTGKAMAEFFKQTDKRVVGLLPEDLDNFSSIVTQRDSPDRSL